MKNKDLQGLLFTATSNYKNNLTWLISSSIKEVVKNQNRQVSNLGRKFKITAIQNFHGMQTKQPEVLVLTIETLLFLKFFFTLSLDDKESYKISSNSNTWDHNSTFIKSLWLFKL